MVDAPLSTFLLFMILIIELVMVKFLVFFGSRNQGALSFYNHSFCIHSQGSCNLVFPSLSWSFCIQNSRAILVDKIWQKRLQNVDHLSDSAHLKSLKSLFKICIPHINLLRMAMLWKVPRHKIRIKIRILKGKLGANSTKCFFRFLLYRSLYKSNLFFPFTMNALS